MLPVVEEAARVLEEEEELRCEIVVPALLSPLPKATLARLLAGRSRIVIAEESHTDFGVGAEFAAALLESGFHGRLLRVGTPPIPIPAARSLETQVIPGSEEIVRGALSLF
jgi:2-oxoisovalerate dehydrogenase E1 component